MGKLKRGKSRIANFLYGEKGQRFFNFAYSIGAAIVIWGALFKILHLPGGNMLLSVGMGTEVLMFILTAFDRPPREYKWEKVYPGLDHDEEQPDDESDDAADGDNSTSAPRSVSGASAVGGPCYIGPAVTPGSYPHGDFSGDGAHDATPTTTPVVGNSPADAIEQMSAMAREMQQLRESTRRLNEVSETLLESYRAITDNSDNISRSSVGYVEQMQALNHNIQGLNTIYEIQLKSVSSQLDAIDRVNRGIHDICIMYEQASARSAVYCDEAEKMARNMQQLNKVYERMLTAMTINMPAAMASGFAQASTLQQPADNPDGE